MTKAAMGWPLCHKRWRVGRYSIWAAWMDGACWGIWYDTTNGQGDLRVDAWRVQLAVMW